MTLEISRNTSLEELEVKDIPDGITKFIYDSNNAKIFDRSENESKFHKQRLEIHPSGKIYFTSDPDIIGTCNQDECETHVIVIEFDRYNTTEKVYKFYIENKTLFKLVVEGFESEWDGRNMVGYLDEEAQIAFDKILENLTKEGFFE